MNPPTEPGKKYFYCDGRLFMGQQTVLFYVTLILVLGTSGLFFAYDCPYLIQRISPAIPGVSAILFVFAVSNLLITRFTDPGIIPRSTQAEPDSTVELNYCITCRIFRPPRASHCRDCDNCVERYDHHCPWVGNCVGKRNYKYFYFFLVSLAFHCVFSLSCALTHLVLLSIEEENAHILNFILAYPASFIVCFVCFISILPIFYMAGYHTYLTSSNLTTREHSKGSYSSNRGNPFSNCAEVLCGSISPSLIDPRGMVTSVDCGARSSYGTVPQEMPLTQVNGQSGFKPPSIGQLQPHMMSPEQRVIGSPETTDNSPVRTDSRTTSTENSQAGPTDVNNATDANIV